MATEEGTDAAFDSFQYQLGSLKLPREASNDLYQLYTKDNPDVPAGQTLDNRSIIIGSKITDAHFEATTVGVAYELFVADDMLERIPEEYEKAKFGQKFAAIYMGYKAMKIALEEGALGEYPNPEYTKWEKEHKKWQIEHAEWEQRQAAAKEAAAAPAPARSIFGQLKVAFVGAPAPKPAPVDPEPKEPKEPEEDLRLKPKVLAAILEQHANMIGAALLRQLSSENKRKARLIDEEGDLVHKQGEVALRALMADYPRLLKEGHADADNGKLEKIKNLRQAFGEHINSEKAMLTAPELFQQLQACKDPEVLAQFMTYVTAQKIIDSREANEWVEAYGVKIGGYAARVYPSRRRRVTASASASASVSA